MKPREALGIIEQLTIDVRKMRPNKSYQITAPLGFLDGLIHILILGLNSLQVP